MNKREIRKAAKTLFPEAKIKFISDDLAEVTNWREIENGRFNKRYDGKHDFFEKIRNADLIHHITCGA